MIKKNIWGPSTWLYLHTIAYNYPSNPTIEDMNKYKILFNNLILPCKECQIEYNNLLKQYPIENNLLSNKHINNWLIDIHNKVNKRLNKPLKNYKDMVDFVTNGIQPKYDIINIIIKIIIVLVIICVIYKIFFLLYNNNGKKNSN